MADDKEIIEEETQTEVEEELEETSETDSTTDETPEEESNPDSDSDDLTAEELEGFSDDEFDKYLDTGEIPDRIRKTREKKSDSESKIESSETKNLNDISPSINTKPTVESNSKKETSKKEQKQQKESDSTVDYEAFYKDLMKPFKANGKEVTPRSKEDVISLMQMGANYTKKMQQLAPMRKMAESLNQANINQEDLNLLIDIHKGNKNALKHFLAKKEIDPMDLSLEDYSYIPGDNIATDDDVKYKDTLLDVQDSLGKIREILDTKWDAQSRVELLRDPKLMRGLHEEIQMGRFDEIQKLVETEKMYGRYEGVPDIQIYSDIVTKLVSEQQKQSITKQEKAKASEEAKANKSKAAPTKSKPKQKSESYTAKDFLSMSDEEFEKLNLNDII